LQSVGPQAKPTDQGHAAVSEVSGGIVLPRALRKPVRQMQRLLNGGFRVTKRSMMVFALVFATAAGFGGIFAGGKSDAVMASVAPSLGIAISKYDISGNEEVSDIDVVGLLAPDYGRSILGYDVSEARKALKENPWIAEATVSKVYPNKLSIKIEERSPFALWQNEHGLQLIDREGRILSEYDGRTHSLPLVVGKGADSEAASVLTLLQRVPDLAVQTKALIRVGDRRWDIELDSGTIVMLPEENLASELLRFAKLDRDNQILERDVERIDLRFKDRLVVKLSGEASELVRAKREEQLKAVRTSTKERNI